MAKFEAKLGLDTKEYDSKLKGATEGFGKFGKEIGSIAAGIAAAAGVFNILKDWFLQTEAGANTMNATLYVTRQLLTDIIMKQQIHLGEAINLAERENKIREGNRKDLVEEARLNRDIRKYRLEAYDDSKSLEERIVAQNNALNKQRELEKYRKRDLVEELLLVRDKLELDGTNTKLLEREAQLIAGIYNADESESLRMVSYLNTLEKQLRDTKQAFTDYLNELGAMADMKDALSRTPTIKNLPAISIDKSGQTVPGLRGEPSNRWDLRQVEDLTTALFYQAEAVDILTSGFTSLFSTVGEGFRGMVDSMIQSITRLVAELLAKAAVLMLLRVLFPATNIGVFATQGLMNLFGEGPFNKGPNMGSLVGGNVSPVIQVQGSIKGRDIQIANRRAY